MYCGRVGLHGRRVSLGFLGRLPLREALFEEPPQLLAAHAGPESRPAGLDVDDPHRVVAPCVVDPGVTLGLVQLSEPLPAQSPILDG